jgi:hypothetical protein
MFGACEQNFKVTVFVFDSSLLVINHPILSRKRKKETEDTEESNNLNKEISSVWKTC